MAPPTVISVRASWRGEGTNFYSSWRQISKTGGGSKKKTVWINEFIVKLTGVDQRKRQIGSMNLKKNVQGWIKEKERTDQ